MLIQNKFSNNLYDFKIKSRIENIFIYFLLISFNFISVLIISFVLFSFIQIAQEPQHIVIRYKHARAFQNNHGDRGYVKKDVQHLASSLRLDTKAIDCSDGKLYYKQFYELHIKEMKDYLLISKYRKCVNIKFQMQKTVGKELDALKKLFYIDYNNIINKLESFIQDAFDKLHPRFRIALWGMFNLNILYKSFLKEMIKEKIYCLNEENKICIKMVDLPKYVGTKSVDDVLRQWMCLDRTYAMGLIQFNSKKIIQHHAESMH